MQGLDLPLRDIQIPEAIGWWPLALGWWILAAGLPLLMMLCYFCYRRLTRQSALKIAVKNLKALKQCQQLDDRQKIVELSTLLRRAAMSIRGRAEVAGLTGKEWLAYLDRSLDGTPFSDGPGNYLLEAPYRKEMPAAVPVQEIFQLSEAWLTAQKIRPS